MDRNGEKWNREETILAFELYCRTPFSKISQGNKEIQELATLLGRTPGSVGLKMHNLAHFDPELQKRNVSAMAHGSKLDAEIFREFSADWEGLSVQAQVIRAKLMGLSLEKALVMDELPQLPSGLTHDQIVKARVGQYFFRTSVLTAYNNQCCITGLKFPKLLVASHIKPWANSDEKTERTNPCNGLSLNPFHDKAFDKGFITVDKHYQVVISSGIKEVPMDDTTRRWFMSYDHQKIILPERFLPGKEFLEYHNDTIFLGA